LNREIVRRFSAQSLAVAVPVRLLRGDCAPVLVFFPPLSYRRFVFDALGTALSVTILMSGRLSLWDLLC
jgi:hypothetical protein